MGKNPDAEATLSNGSIRWRIHTSLWFGFCPIYCQIHANSYQILMSRLLLDCPTAAKATPKQQPPITISNRPPQTTTFCCKTPTRCPPNRAHSVTKCANQMGGYSSTSPRLQHVRLNKRWKCWPQHDPLGPLQGRKRSKNRRRQLQPTGGGLPV